MAASTTSVPNFDLEVPGSACPDAKREPITSHGNPIAAARDSIIHREKIKWTASRLTLPETTETSSCKSNDNTLF